MSTFVLVLHFMVCFVLVTVVLLQRGKGGDIGAALGGGGANTIFGSRGAGNFLTKLTTASAVLFMGTSMWLAYMGSQNAGIDLFPEGEVPIEAPTGSATPGSDEGASDELQEVEDVGGLQEVEDIPAEASGDTATE